MKGILQDSYGKLTRLLMYRVVQRELPGLPALGRQPNIFIGSAGWGRPVGTGALPQSVNLNACDELLKIL
jgi:hypothetical protein